MQNRIWGSLVLLVLLGGFRGVQAQPMPATGESPSVLRDEGVRAEAKEGLDLLYDMQFEEARALFIQIDRRFPAHPIGPFLQGLNVWWEILLDLSVTSHDEAFYALMDEVIARSDELLEQDEEHFDALFFKGAALGFRGRLRSNRREWFKAASDGKRAMDYVLRVAEMDPENDDYAFGKGVYDYYAAVVPQRFPFAKPVMAFFPKGNRERGLELLERTAQNGYFIQTEAAYFLLQIYYLFEKDYHKSVAYVTWLREHHPHNSFFHSIEGRIYAEWGRWEQAGTVFGEVLEHFKQARPGYNAALGEQALYYLARRHMIRQEDAEALDYLLKLEALSARSEEDTYFKVMGRLRQGMAYDRLGQREVAEERYRQVLSMKEWSNVHGRAQRYLDRPYGQ